MKITNHAARFIAFQGDEDKTATAPNRNLQIYNQFRYGQDSDTFLVYNFMQYNLHICNDVDLSVRGGKLRHEFGLYNTTRVNPKTRQGVIQPQAIYWDALDEYLTSGVGVNATLNIYDVEVGFTIDKPTLTDSSKYARVFTGPLLTKTKEAEFGDHYIAYVNYLPKHLPLVVKSSYSVLNLGDVYSTFAKYVLPKNITNNDMQVSAITFGVEYTFDDFIISGETLWFKTPMYEWDDLDKITKGFSVTGSYHLSDHIDLRVNYNEYSSDTGRALFPKTPWISYQKDLNFGVTYHYNNWMFQVEGHHINGAKNIDPIDTTNNVDNYKDWWIIGTNIIYSF